MFKIDRKTSDQKIQEEREDIASDVNKKTEYNQEDREKNNVEEEKIETCYFCLQEFDINKDDLSHYKYGKFPMCDYCSQFYGFYDEKKIK